MDDVSTTEEDEHTRGPTDADVSQEDDTDIPEFLEPNEEPDDDSLDWETRLDNETMLLVVNASAELTVKMRYRYPDDPPSYAAAAILNTSPPMFAQNLGFSPLIAVMEHEFLEGMPAPWSAEQTVKTTSRTVGPGTHYILLESTGHYADFWVKSDNASIELIHSEHGMATFRHHYDGKWDINLRLTANRAEIFDAETHIPMENEFLWVVIKVWGYWEFEFSPGCRQEMDGLSDAKMAYYVVGSREPMDLNVHYEGIPIGYAWFYAVDLPVEPHEPGCWQAAEYWNWGE